MMLIKLILVCSFTLSTAFITFIATRLPLQGFRAALGAPWPYPYIWSNATDLLTLDPTAFQINTNLTSCDVIDEAIKRYRSLIFPAKTGKPAANYEKMTGLTISISSGVCDTYPTFKSKESYELHVKKDSTLTASTIWGALRGLETFSQLVYLDPSHQYLINETYIDDKPRFNHRGLMVDTARHFIPMPILIKNLDAMSYNKLNVFHWHMVDDQSFPYESIAFPELSQKGAYHPRLVYSQNDVRQIIQYARMRGIRVIPEFDTPGHTKSWGKAMPDLLTPCYLNGQPERALYKEHSARELFNPMLNSTFTFLRQFLDEIATVFKDEFIHLGMDEVYPACWQSNPDIADFLQKKGFSRHDVEQVQKYYIDKTFEIIKDSAKDYIIWQDPIDVDVQVNMNAIIQVWKNHSQSAPFGLWRDYLYNVTLKGYRTLFSSCWYLNVIHYGQDWKDMYICDPQDFPGNEAQKSLVVGGEAAIWAEYVDATNILSRVWPRASAVAERLWSPPERNDAEEAKFRLDQQRCRMVRRGIPAEPILDGFCGDYEYGLEAEVPQKCEHPTSSTPRFRLSSLIHTVMLIVLVIL